MQIEIKAKDMSAKILHVSEINIVVTKETELMATNSKFEPKSKLILDGESEIITITENPEIEPKKKRQSDRWSMKSGPQRVLK